MSESACVRHPRAEQQGQSVCGRRIGTRWAFEDLGHAYCSIAGGHRATVCPACARAVVEVFGDAAREGRR